MSGAGLLSEKALLDVRGLTAGYGARPVLRGISLKASGGESVALLGPNGSGKTTLLRCVSGVLRPQGGGIWLAGRAVEHLRPSERARRALFGAAACCWGAILIFPGWAATGGRIMKPWSGPSPLPGPPVWRSVAWMNCPAGNCSGCCWRGLWPRRASCCCWTNWPPGWIWPAWWSCLTCWSAAGPPGPVCSWPCTIATWHLCMPRGSSA